MSIRKIPYLLSLFTLVFTSFRCFAQWVPEGTTWHVHEDDIYQNFPGNEYNIYKASDTLIGGRRCTSIHDGDHKDMVLAIMYSENHRVYVYDGKFELLFDFNLKNIRKDTTYTFVWQGDSNEITAYGTDSININGYYLREQIFECNGKRDYAIEGIGAMSAILPQGLYFGADMPDYKLACVTNDFFGSYPVSATDCDRLVGGIADHITAMPGFSAYPNPCTSTLNIEVASLHRNGTLQMYNMHGEKVYECAITSDTGQKQMQIISVDDFNPGIYALVLQQGQQLTTIKVAVK
jgi:hypothetical protein